MKRLIAFTLFILLSLNGFAQTYLFKVFLQTGTNQYLQQSESEWQPVKMGISLNQGDKIRLDSNSFMGLIHVSGRTLELQKRGTFDVATLDSNIGSRKRGIAAKYSDFVMERAENEGSVSYRSAGGNNIVLLLPPIVKIVNDKLKFKWTDPLKKPEYKVQVKDILDNSIFEDMTTAKEYELDLSNPKLLTQKSMVIQVEHQSGSSTSSADVIVSRISAESAEKMRSELAELQEEINVNSFTGQLVLAEFYEQHELIYNALECYEKATSMSNHELTKKLFDAFLQRNRVPAEVTKQ